jgi:pilus assembly protein CpaC
MKKTVLRKPRPMFKPLRSLPVTALVSAASAGLMLIAWSQYSALAQPAPSTQNVANSVTGSVTDSVSGKGLAEVFPEDAKSFLSVDLGKGLAVRLPRPAKNVFIANPEVADVNPVSNQLVYVFGKKDGETTLYAVDASDRVIFATTIRIGNNIAQLQQLLKLALPNASVEATLLNGLVVLSGYVSSPQEIEEVGRLTQRFVGSGQLVVNKLQTRTPLQVHLKVKFAEVSREVIKQLGINFEAVDTTSGFQFSFARGRDILTVGTGGAASTLNPLFDGSTTFFAGGRLLGLDLLSAVDALEQEGLITVLAEPTLTAISGEKASFLAGGEFPIPIAEENGRLVIQFKEFGVGLEFIPIVHSSNRISLKVKPEVSQLTSAGAIRLSSVSVPGISTRRAETTVELGSGQSFVIAGLLQNSVSQDVSKLPGLGNLPILGALFKSDRFRRQETELVMVVTPYLVKPMQPDQVRLPTDGFRVANDFERFFLGQTFQAGFKPEASRPSADVIQAQPTPPPTVGPGLTFGQ